MVADLSCQSPCVKNARDVDAGGIRRALSPELRPEASLFPPSTTVALTADVRTLVAPKLATLVPSQPPETPTSSPALNVLVRSNAPRRANQGRFGGRVAATGIVGFGNTAKNNVRSLQNSFSVLIV